MRVYSEASLIVFGVAYSQVGAYRIAALKCYIHNVSDGFSVLFGTHEHFLLIL